MSTATPEPTSEDLSAMTVAALVAAAIDHDDDLGIDRWKYIGELQRRGGEETFAAADVLTRSASSRERVLGASILGQIGYTDPPSEPHATIRRRAVSRLVELARSDAASDVIWSAIAGLGHHRDPAGLDAVLDHAASPIPDIREAVASAIPGAAGESLSPASAERMLTTLIALSDDEHGDVRDWALFGLGVQGDLDTPEIRDVLARHLDDPHEDAREEAVLGLARRRDERAFPVVLAALTPETATPRIVEAAAHLSDERLAPGLLTLGGTWHRSDSTLRDALRTCDPAARARWEIYGEALVAELEGRLRDEIGDRLSVVEVAREPLDFRPRLTAAWTAAGRRPAMLTYDLVALVEERLGGNLASAGEIFRADIAEAERAAS